MNNLPTATISTRSARRFEPAASNRWPAFLLFLVVGLIAAASEARAQVMVYESFRPVAAAPMAGMPVAVAPTYGGYVANYTPAGNYAAVTAFSPPVMSAGIPVASAPVSVTSYFAPAASAAVPVTSYYAPTTSYYAPTTAYYAPTTAAYAPVTAYYAPAVATPVTAYYAPAAMQVYRRGLFGVYRPVSAPYYVAPY